MGDNTHRVDHPNRRPETARSSRGHSMLFLIVSTTFLLLVSSSLFYSIRIRATLEQQTTQIAVSGLISALEMAYPAAEALAKSEPDSDSILGAIYPSPGDDKRQYHSYPFLMRSDDLNIVGNSGLPSTLSESISNRLRGGSFVALPTGSIPDPARVCAIKTGGKMWLAAAVPLRGSNKILGLAQDITPHIVRANKVEQVLVGFLALGYVFFLVLLILVLKIITEPLKTLTRAAERFARGDFDSRVAVPKTVSEVRMLAETFNHMGSELKIQRDSLEAYSHDLEEAINTRGLAMDELSRRTRELERINHVSRTISGELDMDHLLTDVVNFTLDTMRAHCAFVALLGSGQLTVRKMMPPDIQIDPQEIDIDNNEIIAEVMHGGRPLMIESFTDDCRMRVCDFTRRYGFKSFVGVPIVRKVGVVGAICCFSENIGAFTSDDSYFLGLLASQLAIAIDNATLFEEIMARDMRRDQQLTVAQKLQKDRMPDNFKQNVAALTCKLSPADELAGDFCDVFTLGRNSLAVVIGDVANKGIAASLMTFSLLSMFRNIARIHKPPCEVLKSINRSLISQVKEDGWFATAFYAKLNTSNGILTYSSAGHEMPILFHGDTGEVEMLDMAGYPLGLFSDFEFETHEIQMKMGDRLVLYTDGVTDAVDPGGKRFGHKTLMDLIAANGKLSCSELTEKVTRSVEEFMGGIKQRDDIIVSILEIQDDPWIHKRVVFRETGTLIAEVMEALAPYNLEMQTTYAIRLSVDEAVSNAWRHGLNEADDVPFEVSYLISDEGFQLRVRDTGAGFDHESLPDPTVEENLFKSHGRGVFLIRQTMDEVEFNETGNEITILKKFPLPAGEFEETSESTSLLDSVPMLRKQQESLSRARKATGPVTSDIDSVDANTPA